MLIESWTHSLPHVPAFVQEARRLGARPTVIYEDESAWWSAVDDGNRKPFRELSKAERAAIKNADVYVYFWGPEDRVRADRLPAKVQEEVTGYNEEWYRIAQKAGLRGTRMNLGNAGAPVAKMFGFNPRQWQQRLVDAGSIPAKKLIAKGERIARAVESGKEMHIEHPNGTDLTLRLKGVRTRIDAGQVDDAAMRRPYGMLSNNPSGQLFVTVDRSKAHGQFISNRPLYLGLEKFDGQKWTFEDGRLTEHEVGLGAKGWNAAFESAPKGKDRFSLLSFGLNPKARELAPVEDTEEGAVMAGIGGNAGFGGRVRLPFLAFSLLGEATIEVDGTPIVAGGKVL